MNIHQALSDLSRTFNIPFHQIGNTVIAGKISSAERHLSSFQNDETGFESFVNHIHLEDIVQGVFDPETDREALLIIGKDIIAVWAERLKPYLNKREVIFYLGGSDSVSLRFHIARDDGRDWIDRSDEDLIHRERIEVFKIGKP